MIKSFLDATRRQWIYSAVEVLAFIMFVFCGTAFFRNLRLSSDDPHMAKASALAFTTIALILFVLSNCIKRLDDGR